MSGYAVASGALFAAFPGIQWSTPLNAGQLTSDIVSATYISNTRALAGTGGVYASEAWSTAVSSSASDSAPATVVIHTTLTASAGGSTHRIFLEDTVAPIGVRDSGDRGRGVWPPRDPGLVLRHGGRRLGQVYGNST
ncbi:hypothetical protein DL765_006257 [Monosporascus sp. GIB2]|nr:hypothetical protein DL765_006257 [Monosporascus sp. GIB2]